MYTSIYLWTHAVRFVVYACIIPSCRACGAFYGCTMRHFAMCLKVRMSDVRISSFSLCLSHLALLRL